MTDFEVYKYYLALKLHFTTEQYDVIQQRGRVRASKQAFAKRKDLFAIQKVAKTYTDEEVANFLIANFVSGDRWGGVFDAESGKRYQEWKRRKESMQYTFTRDVDHLLLAMEIKGKTFEDLFATEDGKHPYILREYLSKTISIETMVILDQLSGFVERFDRELDDTIMWPDISRLIRKYRPFVRIDLGKYKDVLDRRITGSD